MMIILMFKLVLIEMIINSIFKLMTVMMIILMLKLVTIILMFIVGEDHDDHLHVKVCVAQAR